MFEGEEAAVAKKEAKLEYAASLEDVNENLSELSEKETEFLPITTKAYLYLSGTPFKALATGEFIEEQIFNWTYTDEQRAKEEFAAGMRPRRWNTSRPARGGRSRIRTCACCRISSTRSGSCPMSGPVTQWQTC